MAGHNQLEVPTGLEIETDAQRIGNVAVVAAVVYRYFIGKIAEVGTHAELMEKQGIFYGLVETQNQTNKALAETVAAL